MAIWEQNLKRMKPLEDGLKHKFVRKDMRESLCWKVPGGSFLLVSWVFRETIRPLFVVTKPRTLKTLYFPETHDIHFYSDELFF